MPKDLIRVDLDFVFPDFTAQVLDMLAACRARGHDFYWISAYRSWGDQHQLRKLYLAGKGGRAAPAGDSAHQYGIAGDFAHDSDLTKKGLQPDWIASNYDVLGEEAAKVGLAWGKTYNDRPHVQWPGYVSAKELAPLKLVWTRSADGKPGWQLRSLKEVWSHIRK